MQSATHTGLALDLTWSQPLNVLVSSSLGLGLGGLGDVVSFRMTPPHS